MGDRPAVVVALVLFAEAITFQQSMISNIVPKLAASFPQAGANVTWSITILGVAGGATMALVGKLGDLIAAGVHGRSTSKIFGYGVTLTRGQDAKGNENG